MDDFLERQQVWAQQFPECLRPELREALTDGPLGLMVHNRFCISLSPQHDAYINERYVVALKRANKSWEDGDCSGYVFTHERPYRFEALRQWLRLKDVKGTASTALRVWNDSENIWQHRQEWAWLFTRYKLSSLIEACSRQDRLTRRALRKRIKEGQQVVVYRGTCEEYRTYDAMSWTLSQDTAVWFSRRLNNAENPAVLARPLTVDTCFLYDNTRGEKEVIIL